ncbi:uncharacterized protein F4822DRAFT_305400 [Hypoxylon trugodes]|uniref:uncharacterized protein n=1 Tax=Hypoxylon trugodes TaxID=326681 RepID=UPI0021A11C33|nr:uncharacterized protein F4822DRAFT_305400 [Hypoxylon trugodes]KAI1386105.1 hypothetical protein F4822DRAFT_305400 [Hypoxylon trugodes]
MARPGKTQSTIPDSSSASTTTASAPVATSVRARKKQQAGEKQGAVKSETGNGPTPSEDDLAMPSWATRNKWIVFAIASGACAAFNGVFAKLTTNELSTHIAHGVSGLLGLTDLEGFVEVVVRCGFFGLNLAFNGVMWTLFTQALAKGQSTTQVSIMNTSTNFVITALLGLAIFSESLPPLWWAGAAMLVAGNVIIGRGKQEDDAAATEAAVNEDERAEAEYHDDVEVRDDGNDDDVNAAEQGRVPQTEGVLPVEKDDEDEDVALLGDLS